MATKLWWASIGGEKGEPIRVSLDKNGVPKGWFSIGCSDEHPGFEGVELIEEIEVDDIPANKKERAAQERAWKRRVTLGYGYRRFD